MKYYTVDGSGFDGLKMVETAEPPQPGPGEVLVEVRAVALNYRDLLVARGQYGGERGKPIIACSDMAGRVAALGPEVSEYAVGDRVVNAPFRFWPAGKLRNQWVRTFVGGAGVDGVLAESIAYPAEALIPLPAHMSYEEGATLTIAGLTAWAAVVTHGRVRPGEWVLLHGTGGVSVFAAQIARLFGARAIMTTSRSEKAELVKREFGVCETLDYREESWPQLVKEITGG